MKRKLFKARIKGKYYELLSTKEELEQFKKLKVISSLKELDQELVGERIYIPGESDHLDNIVSLLEDKGIKIIGLGVVLDDNLDIRRGLIEAKMTEAGTLLIFRTEFADSDILNSGRFADSYREKLLDILNNKLTKRC